MAVTNEKRGFQHIVRATSISGVKLIPFNKSPHTLAYTDGVGPLSATNIDTGVLVEGLEDGFAIHLPASLNTRTVAKLYVGVFCGRGKLSITLNDGETQYTNTGLLGVTSMASGVYTIEYETVDKWPIEARWVLFETTAEVRSGVEPMTTLQAVTLSVGQPLKPSPSPAPPGPTPSVPSEGSLAKLAGGVLLAGLLAGILGGVLCGRRCMQRQLETSYELDDWSELEEPIRPLGHWQQDTPSGSDHWASSEQILPEVDPDHLEHEVDGHTLAASEDGVPNPHLFTSGPPSLQAASAEDVWSDNARVAAGRSERVV
jgi:hypothetical protein